MAKPLTPTPPSPGRPCLLCRLLRSLGRAMGVLLLPRVFALLCALGIVGLMAPSSLMGMARPPAPKAPASGTEAVKAAVIAAAASAAASAAAPTLQQVQVAASAAQAELQKAQAKIAALDRQIQQVLKPPAPVPTPAPTSAPAKGAAPPAPPPAVAVAQPPAATGSGAQASPLAASAPLRFAPVTSLNPTPLKQPWQRAMLELGPPPFALSFLDGKPAWMAADEASGTLSGTPDKTGLYSFTLRAASKARPGSVIEQRFTLRVFDPKATPARAVAVQAPADRLPLDRSTLHTFRLEAADLEVEEETEAHTEEATAAAIGLPATHAQLAAQGLQAQVLSTVCVPLPRHKLEGLNPVVLQQHLGRGLYREGPYAFADFQVLAIRHQTLTAADV